MTPPLSRGTPWPEDGGKRKVMVYVPPGVHRAIRQVALDEGRPASDVYVEAAVALLAARGLKVAEEPSQHRPAPAREPTLADLAAAVDGLGVRIEEVLGRGAVDDAPFANGGRLPAGTKAADVVAVIVGLLTEAGPAGLSGSKLNEGMRAAGVKSGTAEVVRAILRAAGVIRRDRGRWIADGGVMPAAQASGRA